MISVMIVGAGGFAGAAARYLIGLIPVDAGSGFPIKTFLINLIGCFAIGMIAGAVSKNQNIDPDLIRFLKVGICGGFTTFSSFALETSDLIEKGAFGIALLYAVLSVVLGVAAVICAQLLVR